MKTDGTKEEITDLKGMVEQRIPIPWTGRRKSEALGIKLKSEGNSSVVVAFRVVKSFNER